MQPRALNWAQKAMDFVFGYAEGVFTSYSSFLIIFASQDVMFEFSTKRSNLKFGRLDMASKNFY